MDTERPRQRGLAQLAIGACLALWGCASQPDRLPIEAGDVCGGQRAELAKFQSYYGTVISPGIERVSSTVGGVIGTVVDTFRPNAGGSGTAAGQRIGARAGAAVGRFGGYFLAKVAKFGGKTQALTASVHSDIQAENAEIDRAAVAFADLQQCRFAAAAKVKADLRANRIDREEAQRRLDDIRARFDADAAAAQMIGIKMNEKGQEFQYASAELIKLEPEAQAGPAQQPPKTRSRKARARKGSGQTGRTEKPAPATSEAERDVAKPDAVGVANVTETNVVKAKSFNDQVDKAKAAAQPALSLEGTVGFLLPEGRACRPCA
jgi:hypothetical protein